MNIANTVKSKTGISNFIKKELEFREITKKEFQMRSGLSKKTIKKLFNNKQAINYEVAIGLSRALGKSLMYWIRLYDYVVFK